MWQRFQGTLYTPELFKILAPLRIQSRTPFIQPFIQLPTLQYSIYPHINQTTPDKQALSQQLAQRIYL
jgi:hypothetical protein